MPVSFSPLVLIGVFVPAAFPGNFDLVVSLLFFFLEMISTESCKINSN
jgi:hypothetical protein